MKLKELAKSFLDTSDVYYKEISAIDGIPRLDEIEIRMDKKFPTSFRALYDNFKFSSFEVGEIELFSNNVDDLDNLLHSVFRDEIISKVTLKHGYIHFARPSGGSYDPICFNTSVRRNSDYEIVRLDHEFILQYENIKLVSLVSKSFRDYMKCAVEVK